MKLFRLSLIFLSVWLQSCEKAINIDLQPIENQMVVEAIIENEQPPVVILSKNLDYFSEISSNLIATSYIKNADVVISNGNKSVPLELDSNYANDLRLVQYFYTYKGNDFVGQIGGEYSLNITWDGKSFSSKTTIPQLTRRIDSLWWEPLIQNKPIDTTLVRVMIKAADKPGLGDYIRYFTRVNQGPFYPGFNSVYDDQIIDGITYIIPVDRGVDKSSSLKDNDFYYKLGDTVTVKISNIDRSTYDFWRTFEFNYQSVGNPFSSPIKIIGNISNGAFGYFGGYASQYRSIIIAK